MKHVINDKVDINNVEIQNDIIKELERKKFHLINYEIDIEEYQSYLKIANYSSYGKIYDETNFSEKSLEHYVAAKLLGLEKDDIYIDIASSSSPVPQIYHKIFGSTTYRQDLWYPSGIHEDTIGSDATNMPISDEFATKMALHCSFEHFEGDSDIRFIREANRVLRKGGKMCIIPLYLFSKYAIQTDFNIVDKNTISEKDAILYNSKGWGQMHGRFYDISHLMKCVVSNLGKLRMDIYVVQNEKAIPGVYVKFVAIFEKLY